MRIGVVGVGSMGKNHLRVLDSLGEFDLSCASDLSQDNMEDAKKYGIQVFSNYKEMLPFVDSVAIVTPTITHYEIADFFLQNGKHVMVEKPITVTLEESSSLIDTAKKNGLTLAVGHLERFNPAVIFIDKLVNNPLFIEVQRLGSFSPRSLDVDVIMDLMIHDLDIILNWDKSGVKSIHASGIPIISKKIDICNARIEFNSGLVANVTASRVSQKRTRKLRIFQKQGYVSLDYRKKRVKMYTLENNEIKEILPSIDDTEPLKNLWVNFYKSIVEKKNYNVAGKDGQNALKLAIDVAKSIQTINF